MPRKKAIGKRSAPGLGQPRKGMPFDPEKRAKLIGHIREGASAKQACRLAFVSEKTLYQWLKGKHYEHQRFAAEYRAAEAEGTHEIHKLLTAAAKGRGEGAVKAAVEVLRARDARFGDRELRQARMRLENERLVEEVRAARAKADVAEALAEKAKRDDADKQFAWGLAMLLSDDRLSEACRRELAEYAVATGVVLVERMDLANPERLTSADATPTPG